MYSASAILIVTDSASLERLEDTNSWPMCSLRYDEMKDVDQLLFLDRDSQAITHCAVLNAEEPWTPCHRKGQPLTFVPAIEEVLHMFDPVRVANSALEVLEMVNKAPIHNRETMLINDVDEMFAAADPEGWVVSEIVDQVTLNGRNFQASSAIHALSGLHRKSPARRRSPKYCAHHGR